MSFDILIQGCIFYISPPPPKHVGGTNIILGGKNIIFIMRY